LGEPIQKFGVSGPLAQEAEVVRRGNDPRPNKWSHTRLTITLARKRFDLSVMHCAIPAAAAEAKWRALSVESAVKICAAQFHEALVDFPG